MRMLSSLNKTCISKENMFCSIRSDAIIYMLITHSVSTDCNTQGDFNLNQYAILSKDGTMMLCV